MIRLTGRYRPRARPAKRNANSQYTEANSNPATASIIGCHCPDSMTKAGKMLGGLEPNAPLDYGALVGTQRKTTILSDVVVTVVVKV